MKGTNCFVLQAFRGSCCFVISLQSFLFLTAGRARLGRWKEEGRIVYASETLNSWGKNEITQKYNFSLFSAASTSHCQSTLPIKYVWHWFWSGSKNSLFSGICGQSILKKEHGIKEVRCHPPPFLSFLSPSRGKKPGLQKDSFISNWSLSISVLALRDERKKSRYTINNIVKDTKC